MAKETKNLKLHQVTRPEDDSKAFNLETILNENWEKLDSAVGDLSQPVTTAEGAAIGLRVQNGRLQYKNNESWTELGLEYEDVQNLAARSEGLVTWALPQATDNTRTAIVLCRATKDISNMDYSACLADASITKNTLAQNATSNTYTGLTNATQYWVKAFVKYTLGGKEFYSGGVTVTFTTLAISEVTTLSVNPATELVTWTLPNGSNHTNVEVCYSKTNISGYTYAQCQADSNVTKAELASNATSYTVNILDKTTYYVKVFLRYTSQYSKGIYTSWLNPKQWYVKDGRITSALAGGLVARLNSAPITEETSPRKCVKWTVGTSQSMSGMESGSTIYYANMNKLFFDYALMTSGTYTLYMGIGGTKMSSSWGGQEVRIEYSIINTNISRKTESIAITGYNANKYMQFGIYTNNATQSLELYNIWGE